MSHVAAACAKENPIKFSAIAIVSDFVKTEEDAHIFTQIGRNPKMGDIEKNQFQEASARLVYFHLLTGNMPIKLNPYQLSIVMDPTNSNNWKEFFLHHKCNNLMWNIIPQLSSFNLETSAYVGVVWVQLYGMFCNI